MAHKIRFMDSAHEDFFHQMLDKAGNHDSYHKALFYTLGIANDTRRHIDSLYDFREKGINQDGLNTGWQTSGSHKLTLLAFNLYNGFTQEGRENLSTPYELFDDSFAPYMVEAIRIRYPSAFREPVNLDNLMR